MSSATTPGWKPTDELTVGFIGAGRMCQALSKGFHQTGVVKMSNMICSYVRDRSTENAGSSLTGLSMTKDNVDVVIRSSVVILAVKPQVIVDVLKEIAPHVAKYNRLVISIAAGISITQIEKLLPAGSRVIRVMPNTPALVQCSASVFARGSNATVEDEELVNRLFSSLGYCTSLPEKHLDAVTALSGSGPAYMCIAIEALADGGVKMGLPRDVALKLAAHTLMGTGKMVLETGQHPAVLKDGVCSPGGTTMSGVHHLEGAGFRGALIGAVEAATKRSLELAQYGQQK